MAIPDENSFYVLPWDDEYKIAYVVCDIFKDGMPYEGDTRYVLKKAIEKARNKGICEKKWNICNFYAQAFKRTEWKWNAYSYFLMEK